MKSIQTGVVASALAAGSMPIKTHAATFGDDASFLQKHTPLIVLSDRAGQAKVAVSPAWQGRVMTSSAGGDAGLSFGWINKQASRFDNYINI